MLTSIANTLSTRADFSRPSKLLTSVVPEQKDQELIVPDVDCDNAKTVLHEMKNDEPSKEIQHHPNKISTLSVRAEKVKETLLATNGVIVNAVLLTNDGKVEQIKYNTSTNLKEVNKIVGGRPTIIGSLEDINAIVITSISNSYTSNSKKSGNQLPYPLCQAGLISGDILIYRSDKHANAQDLSTDEYVKYCETNKDLTEQTIKHSVSNDERQLKSKSLVPNESGYTLQTLSIELANQYKTCDESASASDVDQYVASKIEEIVNEAIQNDSPLNDPDYDVDDDTSDDPDYNPNNEIDQKQQELDVNDDVYEVDDKIANRIKSIYYENNGQTINQNELELTVKEIKQIIEQTEAAGYDENDGDLDESVWRKQFDDSLNFVRAKGRFDGTNLAETVYQTYYECNGTYPTTHNLADIFTVIQEKLAEEDINDVSEDDAEDDDDDDDEDVEVDDYEDYDAHEDVVFDDGTAYNYVMANEMHDISGANPIDLIEYSFRILGENMIAQVVSSFNITKRRDPTADELRNSINKLCDDLTERIVDSYEINLHGDDYHFDDYVDDSLDDDESDESDESNGSNDDSDYNPNNSNDQTQRELDLVDEERASDNDEYSDYNQDNDAVDDDDMAAVDGMMQSEVRYSKLNGNGESYSLYFGELPSISEETEMLELAVESFTMRNGRIPNAKEMRTLKHTVIIENRDSIQMMDERDDEEKSSELVVRGKGINKTNKPVHTRTKLLVTPLKTKKNKSAIYEILLEQASINGSGKKQQMAVESFERFNNRKPSKAEIENIRKFVDIDCDNLKMELFDVIDECTRGNDDSIIRAVAVKENKATTYTLDFKDQQNQTETGDVEAAINWFSRFNGREPTKDELKNIYAFTQNDITHAGISEDDDDDESKDDQKDDDDTIDID